MNSEENVSNLMLTQLSSAVELTRSAISEFLATINENSEDEAIINCCSKFTRVSSDYVTSLEDMIALFKVNLDWLPPSCSLTCDETSNGNCLIGNIQEIDMTYADGATPWSFWLSYKSTPALEDLLLSLQEKWKNGSLCKVSSLPAAGTCVVCVDRSSVFRGIVLSTSTDKIRVRNVDNTYVKVVKQENVYVMTKQMSYLHAQTIHCCLTKDKRLKKLWSSDLCSLFKNTMKECELKVKFIESFSGEFPPLHLIEMEGHGESYVDFNEWICIKMFRELLNYNRVDDVRLENLPENVLDPYYKEENIKKDNNQNKRKAKMVQFDEKSLVQSTGSVESIKNITPLQMSWSPQLFIPPNPVLTTTYFLSPSASEPPGIYPVTPVLPTPDCAVAAQYTTTTIYSGLDRNANIYSVPQQLTTSSFIMNQALTNGSTLNVNTPIFEPRKHIEMPTSEEKLIVKQVKKPPGIEKSADPPEPEICSKFSKTGYCLNASCGKKHVQIKKDAISEEEAKHPSNFKQDPGPSLKSNDVKPVITANTSNSTVIPNGTTFKHGRVIPPQNDEISMGNNEPNDELYDEEDDDDMEEPVINGYMPTDEFRLCRFFSKNGRCWKPECHKEHSMPVHFKWTSDTQETVQSTFNLLVLPAEGETIELLVTTVHNPYTFYARLPDVYSDIGEGVRDIETFYSLHKALNDAKNIKNYIPPKDIAVGESELFLVLSSDRYWKRARILDFSEKSMLVFYVDYGDEEKVPKEAVKCIEERFLHLPCQAVLCTLSDLYCGSEDRELKNRGRKHLDDLIRGKIINGKVVNSNIVESSLDLLVICDGLNINNVMVTRGFCEEL